MGVESVLASVLIGGVAGALGTVSGVAQKDALNTQIQATKEAAAEEKKAYDKAQEMLQKAKDEAVSDVEAANLRAEGLLTDLEEASITGLNRSEEGAIATIKQYAESADTIFASSEELALKEIKEAGLLTREAIDSGAIESIEKLNVFSDASIQGLKDYGEDLKVSSELSREQITKGSLEALESISANNTEAKQLLDSYKQEIVDKGLMAREEIEQGATDAIASVITNNKEAVGGLELLKQEIVNKGITSREIIDNSTKEAIQSLSGATDEAVNALTPFQLAGQRGLERVQFLSGMLNEEEKQKHLVEFGNVEASPLFEFQIQEREKQLDRRQKALGRVFSGAGVEEFRNEIDRLTAEEANRQISVAQGLSASGQQASSQIAGLKAEEGQLKANLEQNRGLMTVNQIEQETNKLTGLQSQIANIEQSQGQQLAGIQQNRGLSMANQIQQELGLTGEVASKIAAIEEREGLSIAEIVSTRGASIAANILQQAGLEGNIANQIAQVELQRGQSLSGIEERRGLNVASQLQQEGTTSSQIRTASGTQRGVLASTLGNTLSGLTLNVEQARQAIRQNVALNKTNLATGLGSSLANIKTGQTAQQVSLMANQARQNFTTATDIASLQNSANVAPFQGFLSGLGQGASIIGATQGLKPT